MLKQYSYYPKANLLFLLLLSLFTFQSYSQAPAIDWKVCLGGTGMEGASPEYNTANSYYGLQIIQTTDGGYITAGNASTNNGYVSGIHLQSMDMWVIKTDSQGNFQWQKCLGGQGTETAATIAQTTDGGYIVAGVTSVDGGDVSGHHGSGDMWIVKLDAVGNLVWQKCVGGGGTEKAYSIKQTTDGGYIVAGIANFNEGMVSGHHLPSFTPDMWVVKLDSVGDLVWQKCLGGSGDDVAYSISQTTDGGYIVAGRTQSKNGDVTDNHTYYDVGSAAYVASVDYWVVKLSSTGTIEWKKCLGGTGEDVAYSVQQTSDGGYIVAGRTVSTNGDVTNVIGNRDAWIVKLNSTGILQWEKSFGGTNNEIAYFIQHTTDGGYVVAGTSLSNNGDLTLNQGQSDYWVFKLNNLGILQWQKSLGGSTVDIAYSLALTNDGGFVVAGTTKSQNGDVVGLHYNVDATDFWVVKFATHTLASTDFQQETISLYPNPVNNFLYLTKITKNLIVTDISGKKVITASNVSEINLSHLSKGTYLVSIENENGQITTQKIIKE